MYCTPKSASNNLMVSHGGGVALDFECAPDETFLVHPEAGLLVHANHWQSPVALVQAARHGRRDHAGQPVPRHAGARPATARERGPADGGAREGRAVRRPRRALVGVPAAAAEQPPATLSATVAMIVMQPAAGVMEVAMLPALDRHFTRYGLE